VKKFGAFFVRRASYLIICMKLGQGELSLFSFLVRCIAPLVCNMMYVWEEKKKKYSANCLLAISDGHALIFFGCYFCKDIQ